MRWRQSQALALMLVVVVVGATGIRRAATQQALGSDFHVFWQAGYDFTHGLPLYQPLPGARHFIYPPFAAQVFQALGIFPLTTAAWLFYVASVALIFAAALLCRDIVQRLHPTKIPPTLPLALAGLCSVGFMLENLVMVQVNLLTFVLCLLGIQAFVARREIAAGGWLVAATAIKLTPVFFLAWILIRGTRRSLAAVALFGALCLALPIIQRGVAQGTVDLTDYYQSFLHQFAAGGVVTNYRNQNLGALVYRAVVPAAAEDVPPYEYAYLPSLVTAAPLLYRLLAVGVLAAFLIHLSRLRASRRPLGALEISSVFLAGHLLSGITWKAHLVTLLFVFYAFFLLEPERVGKAGKWVLGLTWASIVVISLGRDLVGSHLHHYLAGYSVFGWVMLLLFALSLTVRDAGNGVGRTTA